MAINIDDWIRFHGTFEADPERKVSKVDFQVEAKDAVSSTNGVDRVPIYFTDIQFQAGNALSGWTPNTKEMLKRLSWNHDENKEAATPNRFEGYPPQVYQNVQKRWYNVLGRGHRVIVVPNYFPEDWDVPILPTGLDLTLYPKEDYDLLRVSTNAGVWLPEEEQWYKQEGGIYQEIKQKYEEVIRYGEGERRKIEINNWENIVKPLLDEHPLHRRYTREFFVDGNKAGSEIKIHATTRTATVNGQEVRIVGEDSINVNGTNFPIDRKKFLLAPKGTVAIRIEFYKQRERTITTYDQDSNGYYYPIDKTFKYLEDAGIGFHGTVSFYQWTYGRSYI
ncbi:hypothetical protein [Bacillus andreraoultii]|uniref:hypothetical protein n=1 Tax=Bacillus andreraoultii TaxID=1499685 RepID=UPI00053A3B83|nr:hypothetical protein [Bacillus andreraoultii]